MAQSCHAVLQFREEHPEIAIKWMKESNYICILSVINEEKLKELIAKTIKDDVEYSVFIESDLDNTITAVVLSPGKKSKRLCSNFPLALKRSFKC